MKKTSSLLSHPKFLLDENVHFELFNFLTNRGYNVKVPQKGLRDTEVASISRLEKRILVTNDADFADPELYSKDDLFSLIWLRIPQSEVKVLINSFQRILKGYNQKYESRLIILQKDIWDVFPLAIKVKLKL